MDLTFSLPVINEAAEQFWRQVGDEKIICFYGEMGTGKTTFIHALCKMKKVSVPLSSPTFSIINEYKFPGGSIFHIDLYRLSSEEEVIRAGVDECIYSGNFCMIEWPQLAERLLPDTALKVSFTYIDAQTRRLHIVDK